jgi:hypothetical protein
MHFIYGVRGKSCYGVNRECAECNGTRKVCVRATHHVGIVTVPVIVTGPAGIGHGADRRLSAQRSLLPAKTPNPFSVTRISYGMDLALQALAAVPSSVYETVVPLAREPEVNDTDDIVT